MKDAKICFKSFGKRDIEVSADEPKKAKKMFDEIFMEKYK